MTIQLDLDDSIVGRIQAEADRLGLPPQVVVSRLIETAYPPHAPPDAEIVLGAWDQFVRSRPVNSPTLSEYAMSRESIYADERLDQ